MKEYAGHDCLELPISTVPKRWYAEAAYSKPEGTAAYKSHYLDGKIFAMAGAGESRILAYCDQCIIRMGSLLRGKPCKLCPSDMRIRIPGETMQMHPDVVVVRGAPQFEDSDARDVLRNPTLRIVILSQSNAKFDRGSKAPAYRKLPALQEHVRIEREVPRTDLYRREGENWLFTEAIGLDGVLPLASISGTLVLRERYKMVALSPGGGPTAMLPRQASVAVARPGGLSPP